MQTHPHNGHGVDHAVAEVDDLHHADGGQSTTTLDHTRGVPSTVAIGGHPVHPALVALPIAFLLGGLAADVATWWTADSFWARGALWLTGGGAGLGLVAALAGLVDFLTIERARVHRIGWVHALSAVGLLLLASTNWLLRLSDPVGAVLPWGIVLSALTAGLVAVAGWTGGELAYRHMIGVTGHGPHAHDHGPAEHNGHDHAPPETGVAPAAQTDGHGGMHVSTSGANGHMAMAGSGGHDMLHMQSDVTRTQLGAMTVLSLLPLVAALLWSMNYADLRIGAHDVAGAVMPPGMIMTQDTPAEAMRDVAAVDLNTVSYTASADAVGDQLLEPRVEGGVKVFDLDVSVIEWNILPNQRVAAYAFNRQVPGPRLRVTQGERVRINVTNRLPESTTVHWHGLILPNGMDGPAHVTQDPIEPGATFTYEFTAQQFGTYFYHSHDHADRQQALGMYGALIIDPRDPAVDAAYDYDQDIVIQLQEWTFKEGYTFPAMPMEGALPNYFTINGKAYPQTQTINAKVGDKLRFRFLGTSGAFIHPMHIHGGPFQIVQTDGEVVPIEAQVRKDTVNVGPGERYDVIWEAREPGRWLLHCHINHHTTNNNVEQEGAGGLTMVINVTP